MNMTLWVPQALQAVAFLAHGWFILFPPAEMVDLMIGILLARPLASLIADVSSWRAFYGLSALSMGLLTAVLASRLSERRPEVRSGYPALVVSL